MGRQYILGILFFGAVWGLSEAVLGDALYRAGVPYASVPLTAIGFTVLTLARAYFPRPGTATLIASFALLYKFLNAPFFACHLLGIVLMGLCYDVFFNVFRMQVGGPNAKKGVGGPAAGLAAGLATYVNYAAFALMITYVARYEPWVQGGFRRILQHVGIEGSLAALTCAILVPLTLRYGERLRSAASLWPPRAAALIPRALTGITAGVWALGIVTGWLHYASRV